MQQAGYTLFEIMVVIVIVGIVSALIARAYPLARDRQQLLLAEQQLQSVLREAQAQAQNEERHPDCLADTGLLEERHCSDIGVALVGRELILFADTSNPDRDGYETGDFELRREELAGQVTAVSGAGTETFIFEAVPPNVYLVADGIQLAADPVTVRLQVNQQQVDLAVYPFGQVTRETP